MVNKIKAILRQRYSIKNLKIGHAGTLDPLATGLLLVCIGKATKTIPQLQDADKTYTGTLILGATTPCFDLEQPIDRYYPYQHITLPLIQHTIPQFVGPQQQVPPIFSAVKINGQRAYQLARDISPAPALQAKTITIHQFDITHFRPGSAETPSTPQAPVVPSSTVSHLYNHPLGEVPPHLPQADFLIRCSKGTYIRSIARDLGLALESGAFLSALRREQIGHYTIDQALPLDQVATFFA